MWDVLGLGCVAVDDLLYVPDFPAPESKVRVEKRQRSCGGLTATALVAAARAGARPAFAGTLGDDLDSRFVLDSLEREGVDVSPVVRRPNARPIHSTIIVDGAHNTRTILYDLAGSTGAALDAPLEDVICAARVLLVDHYGVEGMTRAARIARAAGIGVVADFEQHEWPGFAELLALVDHLILSRSFAQRLTDCVTPEDALARLWNQEREIVAVTGGELGCWYRSKESNNICHVPAFVLTVVDTTGCGDVFHGAYAAALAWGWDVRQRVRFATAAAALKASRGGGHAGIPRRAAIDEFLASR